MCGVECVSSGRREYVGFGDCTEQRSVSGPRVGGLKVSGQDDRAIAGAIAGKPGEAEQAAAGGDCQSAADRRGGRAMSRADKAVRLS